MLTAKNAENYYDDKAAQNNASTKTEDPSEPSKVPTTERGIAIQAIANDEIIENAAATKTGREISAAAAQELREIEEEIQQEKKANKQAEVDTEKELQAIGKNRR